jgi:hypothetical protein
MYFMFGPVRKDKWNIHGPHYAADGRSREYGKPHEKPAPIKEGHCVESRHHWVRMMGLCVSGSLPTSVWR